MRVGGLLVIVGGVLALAAFLCLPFVVYGHQSLTGADLMLGLTNAAHHWRWAPEPALVAWWWVWWVVPALALLAVMLGIAMLASGPGMDKANRQLCAAAAIEAGVIGAIALLALGLLLYAPGVLRYTSTCLSCDAATAFQLAQRYAGSGFWATLDALLIVVVGGVFALIWIATERPEPPPPSRRIRRPVVMTAYPPQSKPHTEKKAETRLLPAAPEEPPQPKPQPATGESKQQSHLRTSQGEAPQGVVSPDQAPADPERPRRRLRYYRPGSDSTLP